MHNHTKIGWNVLMSFLIWTSVFVMGILVSSMIVRTCVMIGTMAYHWLRS